MFSYQSLLVSATTSIKSAMELLDKIGSQFLVVVDDKNNLIGSLTDGDIRRGILKGISLDNPVHMVVHKAPVTALKNSTKKDIQMLMHQHRIKQIIIVNEERAVVGVEYLNDLQEDTEKPNLVVLMAGGLGTRLSPLTDKKPKALLDVGQKPILETIIEGFSKHGFSKFYLSVNYKAEMIREYFKDGSQLGVQIEYLQERQRLGTAGALSLLDNNKVNDPFFVMNGDLLTNVDFQKMFDFHLQQKAIATVGVCEYDFQVPYGVIKTKDGYVTSIEEKPVHNFFVSAGMYLLEPELLQYVPKNKFYDMPTLLSDVMAKNESVSSFPLHEYWLDIGRVEEYHKANHEYKDVFL